MLPLSNSVKMMFLKRLNIISQSKKLIILVLLILITQLKKLIRATKFTETENKINNHDYAKYIAIQDFNRLRADNFTVRLKQANLASKNAITNYVNKTDFDNTLLSLNKIINSNKTKHALVKNELNKLSKKSKQHQQKNLFLNIFRC